MKTTEKTDKSDFIKFYANLPLEDRNDIILKKNYVVKDILIGRPITWHTAYKEINENTELGRIILKKLKI